MKKAVVVGGSNGMGLAISKLLSERGYYVEILSRTPPETGLLPEGSFSHHFFDLSDFDEDLIYSLATDQSVDLLMITAGIGRVADFQFHHTAEIEKILMVNTVGTIKIFRIFFERLLRDDIFYAGIMGSISGWLCSPAATVYAASKAAVVRFVESVNIELEIAETKNRILDVSPGSFKGSKFYGGENNISLLTPLADQIIHHLLNRDTLFIPQYEETFKNVLERYHSNPHQYGITSYEFKKRSGRLDNGRKVRIGYLSGTFDLFHVGHLNLLRRAKGQCDYLIVGIHDSGNWKGKETFIPLDERKAIVAACKYVDKVVDSCREDSDAWEMWHFDKLFVGSDYKGTERFRRYEEFFKDKGVEIVYFPYTQSTSSTQIRKTILLKTKDIKIGE